jgi:phytoene synthase
MYNWTANQISKNPFIVYKRKVKPSKRRIVAQVIANTLTIKKQYKRVPKEKEKELILSSAFEEPIMLHR